jgi:glycosyl transferase family 25
VKKSVLVTVFFLSTVVFAEENFISSLPSFLKQVEIVEENSGLRGVDCIYVINLKERPERWDLLSKRFLEQNLKANRMDAVNGWKIPLEQRNRLIDPRIHTNYYLELNGGEVGCLLSHLSIYQDAWERGFEVIWVCEDDIVFNRNVECISSLLEELFFLDPDWDLLYTEHTMFGSTTQRHRPEQSPYKVLNQDVSDTLARTHGRFGTHSMILSKKGLEKVLSYFYSRYFWAPIDVDLHYIGLKEYSIKQGLTHIQSGFTSDTQPTSPLRHGR